jgi:hypothetical protein
MNVFHSNDGATTFQSIQNLYAGAIQLFFCLHALARLMRCVDAPTSPSHHVYSAMGITEQAGL